MRKCAVLTRYFDEIRDFYGIFFCYFNVKFAILTSFFDKIYLLTQYFDEISAYVLYLNRICAPYAILTKLALSHGVFWNLHLYTQNFDEICAFSAIAWLNERFLHDILMRFTFSLDPLGKFPAFNATFLLTKFAFLCDLLWN